MAQTFKVLGQLYPTANTLTTLYTVPASTSTIISTIVVCNEHVATTDAIHIAVSPAGAGISALHYLFYNCSLPAQTTMTVTLGITLATTDVVRAFSLSGISAFNAYGSELT